MNKAFTLLELIVVIMIIGTLAPWVLINTEEWLKKHAALKQGQS